jgi:hypothetical protein
MNSSLTSILTIWKINCYRLAVYNTIPLNFQLKFLHLGLYILN